MQGLERSSFELLDNGQPQPITDFAADSEPARVLVLIESGPAVYLLESEHLAAAHHFLDGLSRDDRVAVARYSASAELVQNFTPDKRVTASALEDLHFNLGFGSLNLAASLSQSLDWLRSIPGKKSVVLLSTGVDTSPPQRAESVLETLRTGGIRVLAVSLSGDLRSNPTKKGKAAASEKAILTEQQFAQADQTLQALAQASGGRAYFPRNSAEFGAAYAEIAQIIRHEYSLAFAPPAPDGQLHHIEVRLVSSDPAVAASQLADRIDYRRAYVAPAHPAP